MNFLASTLDRAAVVPRVPADAVRSFGSWRAAHYLGGDRWTETYRAACGESSHFEEPFRLRVVRDDLTSDRDREFARGLLVREASVGRSLNRRRIAGPIALDLQADRPWLVTGSFAAPSLAELSNLPLPQRLWIARQTAEELQSLHRAGWLHGSLSPAAILVSAGGSILLSELGFCRELGTPECRLPCELIALDPYYAAPEWIHEQGELTAAADRYSLGALLYRLLCDEPPHASYTHDELWGAKNLIEPRDFTSDHPALPAAAIQLALRLLSRDPLRRPMLSETIERLLALEIACFAKWDAA